MDKSELEKAKKNINNIPDKQEEKKKDKPIYTSFLETDTLIAEQIAEHTEHTEHIYKKKYLYFYKQNPEIMATIEEINYQGNVYKPIDNKIVKEKAILLPTNAQEYGTDLALINEIKDFLFKYFEPPPFYRAILPYLVLFYWVFDRFPFVPYLQFIGLPAAGKSTALDVIGSICYKAISGSGAITIASLFRLAHQFKGTILLDEFELGKKGSEEYRSFVQLLRSGVEDRPVYRTEGEGRKEVELYRFKAPRIFSSQTAISDAALQSRTILIHMSKSNKKLPLYRLRDFDEKAQELRNKLLLWRLRHLTRIDLKEIEYGIPELEKFDRRVQQVLTPIYYLADEDTKNSILTLMEEQEEETKRERLEEIDGQIFLIILEEWEQGNQMAVSEIAGRINDQRKTQGYKNIISDREIGNIVRKIMGIMTKRMGYDKRYHIVLTPKKIDDLKNYYGYSGESSVSSVSPVNEPKNAEDNTEHTDGIPF